MILWYNTLDSRRSDYYNKGEETLILNNIVTNNFKRYSNYPSGVAKQTSNEAKKKRTSFYDDYLEKSNPNKQATRFEINNSALKLPDLTPQKTLSVLQNSETTGSAIKKNIESVLSPKYGELDTKSLFDDIDDKDTEDNLETAESTIKTNIDRGALSKNLIQKLPNLRDVLHCPMPQQTKEIAVRQQGQEKRRIRNLSRF